MSKWKQTEKPRGGRLVGEWRRRIGAFDLVVADYGRSDVGGDVDIYCGVEVASDRHEVKETRRWMKRNERNIDRGIVRAKSLAEQVARKAGIAVPR